MGFGVVRPEPKRLLVVLDGAGPSAPADQHVAQLLCAAANPGLDLGAAA